MSEAPKPPEPGDAELYRLIRGRLEHEDGLIVNRLSWLMASQSFLFTAYAIVMNGPQAAAGQKPALLRLLPVVGIASGGLIYAGLLAAVRAMKWLRETLHARLPDESKLGLPPIHTPPAIRLAGLAAPTILPAVFLLAWGYLLLCA